MCESQGYMEPQVSGGDMTPKREPGDRKGDWYAREAASRPKPEQAETEDAVLRAIDAAMWNIEEMEAIKSKFIVNAEIANEEIKRIRTAYLASKPKSDGGELQAAHTRIAELERHLACSEDEKIYWHEQYRAMNYLRKLAVYESGKDGVKKCDCGEIVIEDEHDFCPSCCALLDWTEAHP